MFKRILLFICHFILSYTASYAQSIVKGRISDKSSKETLPGVIVSCANKSTTTDVNGDFVLQVPAGKQTLTTSLIGYTPFSKSIIINEKDTFKIVIGLEVANKALDEVVVSAGKFEQKLSEVTVSMEVIKTELLQSKAVAQLDQIMNQVPGVYCTDQQVSIRAGSGFTYGAGSRVAMLVDGIPMMSADAGDIKFNYIPIENMAQMEVIKGASSVLYGSSALNGVINMRTKFAGDEPETQVITYTGIYGNPDRESMNWWKQENKSNPMYQGVTFSHSQKLGNFDLVMGGQLYNDDGYRDSANEQRIRANLNLRYRFKKIPGLIVGVNSTIMSYTGRLFFLWKNADSAYKAQPHTLSDYNNQRNNIDPYISYTSKWGGKHNLRSRYFLTNNTNSAGGANQGSRAELYYLEYQWQKRFRNNFNITAGALAMKQVVLAPYLYGTRFGKNYAGYIQADKKFFNRLTVSAGVRAEYYKVDTAQTKGGFFLINAPKKQNLPVQPVFRAGLNYQLFEYTFIRASFGQGYRFPSDAEKYINTNIGVNVYPNPSLQPERGFSSEVGIKQGFKIGNFQGFADAAYFVSHYYNYIDFTFTYGNVPPALLNNIVIDKKYAGFQFQNIGDANINGIDLSVSGTGKIGQVKVDMLSGYTYSNPINPNYNSKIDTIGTVKSNLLRYRNKTMFKNDIQFTYKGVSLGWSIRYTSPMQNIDRRFVQNIFYDKDPAITYSYATRQFFLLPGLAQYRPGFVTGVWVNDFRIGYQVSKNLKVSFLINNFFNVEFMSRPGLVEAPRTFVFQAAFKF